MAARGRITLGAMLLFGALGMLAWRRLEPPPPLPVSRRDFSVEAPTPPVRDPGLMTAGLAARDHVALDAEATLQKLEVLSLTNKPAALELALAADQQLPSAGVMAEARRAMIVTLLADLNRLSEARVRARTFTAGYPRSAYLPLVQGVTGVHPRPRPSELRDAHAPR